MRGQTGKKSLETTRILSWNCREINVENRREDFQESLNKRISNVDVICLQETVLKGPSDGNPQETAYLEGFVEVDRIHKGNGNRGMLIAVRKGILATPKSKKKLVREGNI